MNRRRITELALFVAMCPAVIHLHQVHAQQKVPEPNPLKSLNTMAIPAQKTFKDEPAVPPKLKFTVTPQPISCASFKGTSTDMSALQQTVHAVAKARGLTKESMEALVPRNCPGQEWEFYVQFFVRIGKGEL
jgi:hypothetical protein